MPEGEIASLAKQSAHQAGHMTVIDAGLAGEASLADAAGMVLSFQHGGIVIAGDSVFPRLVTQQIIGSVFGICGVLRSFSRVDLVFVCVVIRPICRILSVTKFRIIVPTFLSAQTLSFVAPSALLIIVHGRPLPRFEVSPRADPAPADQ